MSIFTPTKTSTEQRNAGTPSATNSDVGSRRRRVPSWALAMLVVVGAFALFVVLTPRSTRPRSVLVLRRTVPVGARLAASDLGVVSMSVPAGLRVVSVSAEPDVVGQRATTTLPAGSLLDARELSPASNGLVSVGLALRPGQYPPSLAVGDTVGALSVAGSNESPPHPGALIGVGSVTSVSPSSTSPGVLMVGIATTSSVAPALAASAALGEVALVGSS
jgi:hypothetical protein